MLSHFYIVNLWATLEGRDDIFPRKLRRPILSKRVICVPVLLHNFSIARLYVQPYSRPAGCFRAARHFRSLATQATSYFDGRVGKPSLKVTSHVSNQRHLPCIDVCINVGVCEGRIAEAWPVSGGWVGEDCHSTKNSSSGVNTIICLRQHERLGQAGHR